MSRVAQQRTVGLVMDSITQITSLWRSTFRVGEFKFVVQVQRDYKPFKVMSTLKMAPRGERFVIFCLLHDRFKMAVLTARLFSVIEHWGTPPPFKHGQASLICDLKLKVRLTVNWLNNNMIPILIYLDSSNVWLFDQTPMYTYFCTSVYMML